MATTTNFGWTTPDDTDLVKDGAAAIRTLGSAIDTSLVDLKGGTTGQILSKASNTDLDYSWTTPADQTPLTTKGDLFTFTTVDARLPVGSDGQALLADSSTATGLAWGSASPSYTFTTYTPSGGFTIGNGTATGGYVEIGNFVYGYIKLTWGSTSSISEIGMHATLPVAVDASMQTATMPIGYGIAYDASAGEYFPMDFMYRGTNKIKMLPRLSNGTYSVQVGNGVDQGVPFNYASGDAYYGWFAYRK